MTLSHSGYGNTLRSATEKAVSFRTQLKGTLSDFLAKEQMHCLTMEEGLLELVVALSNYTEEGRHLYPQVILCEELDEALRMLQCSDPLFVGKGPRDKATMTEALKRCAPLALDGWIVYLQQFGDHIEYGVLRNGYSPTALSIRDTMQNLAGQPGSPRIIIVTQLADKAVELLGTCSGTLRVYFSSTPDDAPSPVNAINDLTISCCSDVPTGQRDQLQSFVKAALATALHYSHGVLIAVMPQGGDLNLVTSDGVILTSPISLSKKVEDYAKNPNDINLASLTAYRNLFMGMLSCDGAVITDSRCMLLGYNLFINTGGSGSKGNVQRGGARRRAYTKLKHLVNKKVIESCFMQSSDGGTEFYTR